MTFADVRCGASLDSTVINKAPSSSAANSSAEVDHRGSGSVYMYIYRHVYVYARICIYAPVYIYMCIYVYLLLYFICTLFDMMSIWEG